MIEDKKIGLKVAESKEEAFWVREQKAREEQLRVDKASVEIGELILEYVEKKTKVLNKSKA